MNHAKILIFVFSFSLSAVSQTITWSQVQKDYLPEGISLFKGERENPKLQAFYLKVDVTNKNIAIRPYHSGNTWTVKEFNNQIGAYASVNGGYFGGSTSYSSVIQPREIKAINVKSVTRNSKSYPLMRSLFSMDTLKNLSVDWIYHYDNTLAGLYTFEDPLLYTNNDPDPLSAPQKSAGTIYDDVLIGIGGGPTLVKNSAINVTYDEEIMWGSGVGLNNRDPRTAIGYTDDKYVIMLVADGRQSISEGLSLPELAQVMINLGCVEAMNLDGGGSSQMAGRNEYINSPSEQRAVPSIFSVVHYDSLGLPRKAVVEKIIDTSDTTQCELIGENWFESNNEGFYGGTKSLLNEKGNGDEYAYFKPMINVKAEYELYAWWVAAFNRCQDTPFIIRHYDGVDTVRMDQSTNGSSWNLVGNYIFSGDSSEGIIISEAAYEGTYIVADAIRLVAYDTSRVSSINEDDLILPDQLTLYKNYPNPFNNVTTISYSIKKSADVRITIYDVQGRLLADHLLQKQQPGINRFRYKATGLSSGLYYYKLQSLNQSIQGKMIFLK